MAIQKRRHHFVPATYLRRFADDRGMLAICRKETPETVTWARPNEAALRNFYYSQPVPDGSQNNNALEDVFSTFESSWPSIAETLETGRPGNGLLSDLLGFIGFQRVRVPAFRDAIEQSMARFAQSEFDRFRAAGSLPPPPEAFPDLLDHVQITIDPHQSIHAMAQLLPRLGPTFERFGYRVLHNESRVELITSDNPVSYFCIGSDDQLIPYPLQTTRRAELLFPISPATIIHGGTDDRERFRRRGLKHVIVKDPERIRNYNRIIAQFAYEAVISKRALPVAFTRRFAQSSPVLDPTFPGFDPDGFQLPHIFLGEGVSFLSTVSKPPPA